MMKKIALCLALTLSPYTLSMLRHSACIVVPNRTISNLPKTKPGRLASACAVLRAAKRFELAFTQLAENGESIEPDELKFFGAALIAQQEILASASNHLFQTEVPEEYWNFYTHEQLSTIANLKTVPKVFTTPGDAAVELLSATAQLETELLQQNVMDCVNDEYSAPLHTIHGRCTHRSTRMDC